MPRAKADSAFAALGRLLEDEGILWKVLSSVAETDLPACRLVCRRWCKTSYRLPVSLKVSSPDALLPLAWRFPHAASLVFAADIQSNRRSRGRRRDVDLPYGRMEARSDAAAQAMSRCPTHMRLSSLRLGSTLGAFLHVPKISHRLKRVRTFPCGQLADDSNTLPYFRTAQLGEESISGDLQSDADQSRSQPSKLRDISLEQSELADLLELPMSVLFPSLTHLQITQREALSSVRPTFTVAHCGHAFRLEHLKLHAIRLSDGRFFGWLCQMKRLKSLCLDNVELVPQSTPFEALSCLEALDTLCLYPLYIGSRGDQLEPPCLDEFSHLTKLHFYSCEGSPSLPCLTTLKDLTIIFRGINDPTADFVPQLTQLETLNLDTLFGDVYASISPLKHLQRLTLAWLGMSESQFLECLKSFSLLKHLDFAHCFTEDEAFFDRLSEISTLESLSMRSMETKKHGCDLGGQGRLPNLKCLTLIDFVITASEVDALWRNLSSLNKLEIL